MQYCNWNSLLMPFNTVSQPSHSLLFLWNQAIYLMQHFIYSAVTLSHPYFFSWLLINCYVFNMLSVSHCHIDLVPWGISPAESFLLVNIYSHIVTKWPTENLEALSLFVTMLLYYHIVTYCALFCIIKYWVLNFINGIIFTITLSHFRLTD